MVKEGGRGWRETALPLKCLVRKLEDWSSSLSSPIPGTHIHAGWALGLPVIAVLEDRTEDPESKLASRTRYNLEFWV